MSRNPHFEFRRYAAIKAHTHTQWQIANHQRVMVKWLCQCSRHCLYSVYSNHISPRKKNFIFKSGNVFSFLGSENSQATQILCRKVCPCQLPTIFSAFWNCEIDVRAIQLSFYCAFPFLTNPKRPELYPWKWKMWKTILIFFVLHFAQLTFFFLRSLFPLKFKWKTWSTKRKCSAHFNRNVY